MASASRPLTRKLTVRVAAAFGSGGGSK